MSVARGAISIHAAREGGDLGVGAQRECRKISIHAAREGGDMGIISTSNKGKISIHAAREGGDYGQSRDHRNA